MTAYSVQTRMTLGQLCAALWDSKSWPDVIQPGFKPGTLVTPLALRRSALDCCAQNYGHERLKSIHFYTSPSCPKIYFFLKLDRLNCRVHSSVLTIMSISITIKQGRPTSVNNWTWLPWHQRLGSVCVMLRQSPEQDIKRNLNNLLTSSMRKQVPHLKDSARSWEGPCFAYGCVC
jgi:hypothetical protein